MSVSETIDVCMHSIKFLALLCVALSLSACASLFKPEPKCHYPARIIDKVELHYTYSSMHSGIEGEYPFRVFGWFGNSNVRFGGSLLLDDILLSHDLLPKYRYLIHQENGKKIEIALPDDWHIGKCVNVLRGRHTKRVSVMPATNCNPKFIPPALQ